MCFSSRTSPGGIKASSRSKLEGQSPNADKESPRRNLGDHVLPSEKIEDSQQVERSSTNTLRTMAKIGISFIGKAL